MNNELKEFGAMWRRLSKDKKRYFLGRDINDNNILGFYNLDKKNEREPDLQLYESNEDGSIGNRLAAMWTNESKKGTKYLRGTIDKDHSKIVGFINEKATKQNLQPYLRIYYEN